jgi:hypothetical protein
MKIKPAVPAFFRVRLVELQGDVTQVIATSVLTLAGPSQFPGRKCYGAGITALLTLEYALSPLGSTAVVA